MRWYVEPLAAEQRAFNDATLKLIDELYEAADRADAGREAAERSRVELDERLRRVERRGPVTVAAPVQTVAAQPAAAAIPDYFAFEARMRGSTSAVRARQRRVRRRLPRRRAGARRRLRPRRVPRSPRATPASRRAGSTPTPTWSRTRAARGSTSSRPTPSRTSRRSRTARSAASSWRRSSSTCRRRRSSACSSSRVAKLRPGGVLVAETINPLSPLALRNYFADLTHAQPLVPETLALLARAGRLPRGRDALLRTRRTSSWRCPTIR